MKDELTIWTLTENVPVKMYVESLKDDYEGFRILMQGEDKQSKMLRITFENALSYRNINESYYLKKWNESKLERLGKTFYRIKKSSYIDFFHEMTLNLYSDWEISHYAIYTTDDCIDIISETPPLVEWL